MRFIVSAKNTLPNYQEKVTQKHQHWDPSTATKKLGTRQKITKDRKLKLQGQRCPCRQWWLIAFIVADSLPFSFYADNILTLLSMQQNVRIALGIKKYYFMPKLFTWTVFDNLPKIH